MFIVIMIFAGSLILFIQRHFSPKGLLFEQIILSSLAILALGVLVQMLHDVNGKDKYSIFTLILLSASLFFSSGNSTLLNIDRSRSFYILIFAEKYESKLTMTEKYDNFFQGIEKIEFERRLEEQNRRKLLSIDDDQIALTDRGRFVLRTAKFLAYSFNLEQFIKVLKNA
jgi:hypothetical protein